jgi:hypothetical protein
MHNRFTLQDSLDDLLSLFPQETMPVSPAAAGKG